MPLLTQLHRSPPLAAPFDTFSRAAASDAFMAWFQDRVTGDSPLPHAHPEGSLAATTPAALRRDANSLPALGFPVAVAAEDMPNATAAAVVAATADCMGGYTVKNDGALGT